MPQRPNVPDVEQLPQYRLINQARGLFHIPATGAQVPGGAVGNPMLEGSKALETLSKTFAAFARTVEEDFRKKMPEWAEAGIDQYKGKSTGLHIFGQMKPAEARKYLKEHAKEFPDFVANHASRPDFLLYMQYAAGTRHPKNGGYEKQLHERIAEFADPNKTLDFEAEMKKERDKFLEGLSPDASFYYRQGMASVMSEGRDSIESRFRNYVMKMRQDRTNNDAVRDTMLNIADTMKDAYARQKYSTAKVLDETATQEERDKNNQIRNAEGFQDAVFNQDTRDLWAGPATVGLVEREKVFAGSLEIAAVEAQLDNPDMDIDMWEDWILNKVEYAPGKTFKGSAMQPYILKIVEKLHRNKEDNKRRAANSTVGALSEVSGAIIDMLSEEKGGIPPKWDINDAREWLKSPPVIEAIKGHLQRLKIPEGKIHHYVNEISTDLVTLSANAGKKPTDRQAKNTSNLIAQVNLGDLTLEGARNFVKSSPELYGEAGVERISELYKREKEREKAGKPSNASNKSRMLADITDRWLPTDREREFSPAAQDEFKGHIRDIHRTLVSIGEGLPEEDQADFYLGGWEENDKYLALIREKQKRFDELEDNNLLNAPITFMDSKTGKAIRPDIEGLVEDFPGFEATYKDSNNEDVKREGVAESRARLTRRAMKIIENQLGKFFSEPTNLQDFDGKSVRRLNRFEIEQRVKDRLYGKDGDMGKLREVLEFITDKDADLKPKAPDLFGVLKKQDDEEDEAAGGTVEPEATEGQEPVSSADRVELDKRMGRFLRKGPATIESLSKDPSGGEVGEAGGLGFGEVSNADEYVYKFHGNTSRLAMKAIASQLRQGGQVTEQLREALHGLWRNEGTFFGGHSTDPREPSTLMTKTAFLEVLLMDDSMGVESEFWSVEDEIDEYNEDATDIGKTAEGKERLMGELRLSKSLGGISLEELTTGKTRFGGLSLFNDGTGRSLYNKKTDIPFHITLMGPEGYIHNDEYFFAWYEDWKTNPGNKDNPFNKIMDELEFKNVVMGSRGAKVEAALQHDGTFRRPTSREAFMATQHRLRTLYSNVEKGPAVAPAKAGFFMGPFFESAPELAERYRSVEPIYGGWIAEETQEPSLPFHVGTPWARFREREDKTFGDAEFTNTNKYIKKGLAEISGISRGYTGPKRSTKTLYNWYTRVKPRTLTTPAMPPNYNQSAARGSRFTIPKETKE